MSGRKLYAIDVFTITLGTETQRGLKSTYLVLADSEDAARGILESREPPTNDQPVVIKEVKNADRIVEFYNLSETSPIVFIQHVLLNR